MLTKKLHQLFFSYGLLAVGTAAIFFAPVSLYHSKDLSIVAASVNGQIIRADNVSANNLSAGQEGGDLTVLPFSKPVMPLPNGHGGYNKKLTAAAAMVMDSQTKKSLFEKNIKEARPLASITKLMSAIVLLDLPINWHGTTTISAADGESDQHAHEGEIFALDDLWNVALIGSSNKAVNALVRSSRLTVEQFVEKMNKKAVELGLRSLRFVDATGLSDKNIGNVQDTSNLLLEALRFEKIYATLHVGEYYTRPLNKEKMRRVWSTNWLLTNWEPNNFKTCCIAGKTGYIPESLYNFTVSLTNEKKRQIIVTIFGSSSNEGRFSEARDLAEWTFGHYLWPDEEGYEKLTE